MKSILWLFSIKTLSNKFNDVTQRAEKHLVEAVYCTGIRYGTPSNWMSLFNKSINSIPAEQNVIWQSLACSKDYWILKSFLEMTLNESIIRRSDVRRVYTYYSMTALSRSVYFEFILKNWQILYKKYFTQHQFVRKLNFLNKVFWAKFFK